MPDILEMLTHERDKLNRAIEAIGGTIGYSIIGLTKQTKRRKMSAASRARMSAAQRLRRAKAKAQTKTPAAPAKKWNLTPATRIKIGAAKKAWWKAKRKAEKMIAV